MPPPLTTELEDAALEVGYEREDSFWFHQDKRDEVFLPGSEFTFDYPESSPDFAVTVKVAIDGTLQYVSMEELRSSATTPGETHADYDEAQTQQALGTPDGSDETPLGLADVALALNERETLLALLFEQADRPLLAELVKLRMEIDENLDACLQHIQLLNDGVARAADQVQDMRITWLEQGPEVKSSDILVEVLLTALPIVGTALIFRPMASIVRLGFMKRSGVFRARRALHRARAEKTRSVKTLEGRFKQEALELEDDFKEDISKYFDLRRRRISQENKIRMAGGGNYPSREQWEDQLQRLKAKERLQLATASKARLNWQKRRTKLEAKFQEEIDGQLKALKMAKRQLKIRERKTGKIDAAFEAVSNVTVDAFVNSAKGVYNKYHGAAPDVRNLGESPIVAIRGQAQSLAWHETQRVNEIRCQCDGLLRAALMGGETELGQEALHYVFLAFSHALDAVQSVAIEPIDYEIRVRAFALAAEQSIWALLLHRQFRAAYTKRSPMTGRWDIPTNLIDTDDRVIVYLAVLFGLAEEEPDEVSRSLRSEVAEAIDKLANALLTEGNDLLGTIGQKAREELEQQAREGRQQPGGGTATSEPQAFWKVIRPLVFKAEYIDPEVLEAKRKEIEGEIGEETQSEPPGGPGEVG